MGLTTKQELFSKLVALDGLSASEAYRQIYDTNPINQSSIHEQASKLLSNPKVSTRVQELSEAVTSKLVWNKAMVIEQLAINVEASRNVNQFAASNRSLELLGKAIGNVFEPEIQQVNGTVSVIHSLSDSVLEQLEALAVPSSVGPTVTVDDTVAIDVDYSVIEPD
tara:strand:- start:25 stop:522 length:498 start_codon:yes stop_codon:yes gene_type:complete